MKSISVVLLVILLIFGVLGSPHVACANLLTGPINGLPEGKNYTWGDGINDLSTQWSVANAPAGRIWIYGSDPGNVSGIDFYVAKGLTDPTTIKDAAEFKYITTAGEAEEGDTVFFHGGNGYYGAWRIDNIDPTNPHLPLLYGQWYFQSDGTGSFSTKIQVIPGYLNFGYVPVGSTKDLSLTVKNAGGGTLTGNATTSAPFSIVSGGSYTLDLGESQVVTVRYQPTSQGPHTGTIAFTDGGSATVPVTGTTKPLGLHWLLLLLGN